MARAGAPQTDGDLVLEDLQHALNVDCAVSGERVQRGAADADGARARGQCLGHVGSPKHTAAKEHLKPLQDARPVAADLEQGQERRRRARRGWTR